MAKVIAVLSPEVAAVHEFERLCLTAKFAWQYEMIRWMLSAGFAKVPLLDGLSDLVSGLSVRTEAAMKELGERAAAAAEWLHRSIAAGWTLLSSNSCTAARSSFALNGF